MASSDQTKCYLPEDVCEFEWLQGYNGYGNFHVRIQKGLHADGDVSHVTWSGVVTLLGENNDGRPETIAARTQLPIAYTLDEAVRGAAECVDELGRAEVGLPPHPEELCRMGAQ